MNLKMAERQQVIDQLLHETLNHARDERSQFLVQACAGDELLRKEVEALVASHERAEKGRAGLRVGDSIGPYTIRAVLGIGGMGEVYLAKDQRLGRQVALKLLPAQFSASPERIRRFELEARAASALNHPNIVTIHEIGDAGGAQFIVSEFVDGKTIRDLMTERTISVIEALDITIQASSALDAAHKAGIVHRDIKPENMMLRNDGYLKILDFGLAKLTEPLTPGDDSSFSTQLQLQTDLGMVMGTVRYMSPEQIQGEDIDARTDLWSLGVVLFEILNGCVPFEGKTTSHVFVSILENEPKPFKREVPSELQRILTKLLRKKRDMRYQSARDVTVDLKNLKQELEGHLVGELTRHKRGLFVAIAALIIGAGIVSYSYVASRRAKVAQTVAAPTADAIDSIAVLPFVNESKDPTAEYLSEGISDSIINRLSKLSDLRVASLSSALRYKDQAIDAASAGRDLKVRAVLIGWMTKRGDSLSFRAELVDVHDNRRLWGGNYPNRQLSDLLQVQEDISQRISENLRLHFSGEDRERLEKRETSNSEAYQLYLQGRFYWNKYTEEGFRKSIEYFKEAVGKDPAYALAYSGLADAYSLLGEQSFALPKESFPQARAYAEKALALDETLADAHLSLGIVELFYDWDWPGAEKELRRAKELDPNNPQVHHFYGHYLQVVGRAEEAIDQTKRGLELDPTSLIINAELGWAYYCARQYDQAIAQDRKTLEFDPNFVYSSWVIAQSYAQTGRYQESVAELKRARIIDANWAYITAELGYAYARLGKQAEAEKILQQLIERDAREYLDAILIAYIYVGLGQKDHAFVWLEKAYQERSGLMPWLRVEPKWDPLRGDGRFADLLRRIAR